MYRGYCVLLVLMLSLSLSLSGQQSFRAAFWNLENLFDTIDNPVKFDDDFTADGLKNWTKTKFYSKVKKLSKAIIAMGEWESIAVLGVCEVENDAVLKRLLFNSPLKNMDYGYICPESSDRRGIGCALIFLNDIFYPLFSRRIVVKDSNGERLREILYVKGNVHNDTLHVFVNHWPSRRGGYLLGVAKRAAAAKALKVVTDSLFICQKDVKILIMGDFNDDPDDCSLNEILGAKEDLKNTGLVNLTYKYIYKNMGSLRFGGSWFIFDNIIVSSALIGQKRKLRVMPESCRIFDYNFIFSNRKQDVVPFPTYRGNYYFGGVSDHFPVVVDFEY